MIKRIVLAVLLLCVLASRASAAISARASSTGSTAGATSMSITKPTGTVAGDFMLAEVAFMDFNSIGITITAPTGWTVVNTKFKSDYTEVHTVYSKLAGASEPASYSFSSSTTIVGAGGITSYTSVNSNPIDGSGGNFVAASATISAPSLTAEYTNDLFVGFYAAFSGEDPTLDWTAPTGMTKRWTVQDSGTDIAAGSWDTQLTVHGASASHAAVVSGTPDNSGIAVTLITYPNYPFSDAGAQALVTAKAEQRSGNATANAANPTWTQLGNLIVNLGFEDSYGNILLHNASGQYTGHTDELLQHGCYKWGFDPDLCRAIAIEESNWEQSAMGDLRDNGLSMGIFQVMSDPTNGFDGTCEPVDGVCPEPLVNGHCTYADTHKTDTDCLSYKFTAFNIDYKLAVMRSCMNGSIGYLANDTPATGHNTYTYDLAHPGDDLLYGCVGDWYSGHWWNTCTKCDGTDNGAVQYVGTSTTVDTVKYHLAQKEWTLPGFSN